MMRVGCSTKDRDNPAMRNLHQAAELSGAPLNSRISVCDSAGDVTAGTITNRPRISRELFGKATPGKGAKSTRLSTLSLYAQQEPRVAERYQLPAEDLT